MDASTPEPTDARPGPASSVASATHPRPQLRRDEWLSLDGSWDFAVSAARVPRQVEWGLTIEVPYPPESRLSGLSLEGELAVVWYRRNFEIPRSWLGQPLHIHFGAVDYRAEVWVNGHRVGSHEGGHTPFDFDIAQFLVDGAQELCLRVEDPPAAFDMPRGKQDWQAKPHSIWYPRTTGIWQSVWLEPLAPTHIARLRLTPDLASFSVTVEAELSEAASDLELELRLSLAGQPLANDRMALFGERIRRTLYLPDPGIDDARDEFLWSPAKPTLLDLEVVLRQQGEVVDRAESYLGLRSVEVRNGRLHLNGRPYYQRLVLDQGFWNESLLAAPSEEALRRDVELAKAMGFNGVRKHQKLEDPRYLYWADQLGLLVWTELPSAYAFNTQASRRLVQSCMEAVERDYNHPCVVAWVPFNESWGVPDLPTSEPQRNLVVALYHLLRSLDPTRPVVDNDGWEHQESDIFTVHDYSSDPDSLLARYGDLESWRQRGSRFQPGGRALQLSAQSLPESILISEFGGVRYAGEADEGWGYSEAVSADSLLESVKGLVFALRRSPVVSGYCYTQFADTFQEQNGLLFADRRPKVPLGALAEVFGKGGAV